MMKRIAAIGRTALVAAGGCALFVATPSSAQPSTAAAVTANEIASFHAARGQRPLWLADKPAADALIALLRSASLDDVGSGELDLAPLVVALAAAKDGDPVAVAHADALFSDRFVRYARSLRTVDPRALGIDVSDSRVRPSVPGATSLLRDAAAAPSLTDHVRSMKWMNQNYAPLRAALAAATKTGNTKLAEQLRLNLQRVRVLPDPSTPRYVFVNIPAQRLEMVEHGRVVGSMRVVVGQVAMPTPTLVSMISHLSVNPYWNLPVDLVAERIAANVIKEGVGYIERKGYHILSDWSEHAKAIDPATIDWNAVQAGKITLRMRQEPSAINAMGRVKFMFPNVHGVYLHDTPQKDLLALPVRTLSAGCVRLEAAPRLSRWLMRAPLSYNGQPEERKQLQEGVPIFLVYLTAVPSATRGQIAHLDDIYGRDAPRSAKIAAIRSSAR